jgi:hypothetical protein
MGFRVYKKDFAYSALVLWIYDHLLLFLTKKLFAQVHASAVEQ